MSEQISDQRAFLANESFQALLDALRAAGYRCVGPQVRDGAIVYDTVTDVEQLPRGRESEQAPAYYRLVDAGHRRYFAWANGPQALKPLVFKPRQIMWRAHRDAGGRLQFEDATTQVERVAFIGARACDLAALFIHDKHFLKSDYVDPAYRAVREGLFIVAVNCSHPAATCFCSSTGDGPAANYGYDIALTELEDGFVLGCLSDKGSAIAQRLPTVEATREQLERAAASTAAAARQSRSLPSRNLRGALFANLEHPRWNEVAERCLSCGNCTSVCPTCFCHAEVDAPALDGVTTDHYREWDSCFTAGHSYIHGFTIRAQTRERYRQWLTHKLGSWHDQYGRSGCVGCGRCIAWCPVGIDVTEEARAICGS